jgi:hypothetical protein
MATQFGWKIANGTTVPCAREQAVLHAIRECRFAGLSYRQILELLKGKGIPSNG